MQKKIFLGLVIITVATLGCKREKPVACFTSGEQVSISDSITFDLSCSENSATNNTWDFGDGTVDNSASASTITHSYTAPGQYTVTLTVCEHAMWFKGKVRCDDFSKTVIVGP